MELKAHTIFHLLGQRGPVAPFGSLVSEFGQIVGLKLHAIDFVVTAQLGNLLFPLLAGQRVLPILIRCKLPEEVFLGEFLPPLLLGTKVFGDGEERHDGVMVDGIHLNLVQQFHGVRQSFGNIGKDFVHLFPGLEPFLFGIEHSAGVVQVLTG